MRWAQEGEVVEKSLRTLVGSGVCVASVLERRGESGSGGAFLRSCSPANSEWGRSERDCPGIAGGIADGLGWFGLWQAPKPRAMP
jgi:hypothetical protein